MPAPSREGVEAGKREKPDPAAGPSPRKPVRLRHVLRHLFFLTYDRPSALVVPSLTWSIFSLPWFLAAFLCLPPASAWTRSGRADLGLAAAGSSLLLAVLSPPTVALLHAFGEPGEGTRSWLRAFWRGFRLRFRSGLALGLLAAGALTVLVVNLGYYAGLPGAWAPVGWVLVGILAGIGLTLATLLPGWVVAVSGGDPLLAGLRRAAGWFFARPGFCAGGLLVAAAILAVSAVTVAGFLLFGSALSARWFRLCYEVLDAEGARRACDLSEGRGLRELWRPWSGGGRDA